MLFPVFSYAYTATMNIHVWVFVSTLEYWTTFHVLACHPCILFDEVSDLNFHSFLYWVFPYGSVWGALHISQVQLLHELQTAFQSVASLFIILRLFQRVGIFSFDAVQFLHIFLKYQGYLKIRDQIHFPWTDKQILIHCTTREVPMVHLKLIFLYVLRYRSNFTFLCTQISSFKISISPLNCICTFVKIS